MNATVVARVIDAHTPTGSRGDIMHRWASSWQPIGEEKP